MSPTARDQCLRNSSSRRARFVACARNGYTPVVEADAQRPGLAPGEAVDEVVGRPLVARDVDAVDELVDRAVERDLELHQPRPDLLQLALGCRLQGVAGPSEVPHPQEQDAGLLGGEVLGGGPSATARTAS